MRGFLDEMAPSRGAEINKAADVEYLGKVVARNFIARLGYKDFEIYPNKKYGIDSANEVDGLLYFEEKEVPLIIRSARTSFHIGSNRRWAIGCLNRTVISKKIKRDGLCMCILLPESNIKGSEYWDNLKEMRRAFSDVGVGYKTGTTFDKAEYINNCGFLILKKRDMPNFVSVLLSSVLPYFKGKRPLPFSRKECFCWGFNRHKSRALFEGVVADILEHGVFDRKDSNVPSSYIINHRKKK
ncbi:MAG: hypothetical protein HQK96_01595 [Nitrospirae bacterium]|nr:hypothetical protein [Nitrospirota bacterium]